MSDHAGISPEALMRHAGFVRALGLQLLRDPHLADDVVQDTMLAALRRPPRDGSRLRAWLGAVARRVALKTRRAYHRRPQRERKAARPESLPSASEVTAQLEIQRKVVAAVAKLEEPYRSTVVHRFFHERTPTEIADALDVPVKTVESRLARALHKLRARLDAEHGGRRGAWSAALLPLAPPRVAKAAAGGVLIVSVKAKVAVAVAALVVAGAGVWTAGRIGRAPPLHHRAPRRLAEQPVAPEELEQTSAMEAGVGRGETSLVTTTESAKSSSISPLPPQPWPRLPAGTVAGWVRMQPAGEIPQGTKVRASGFREDEHGRVTTGGEPEITREVEAGHDGAYRIEGLPPGGYWLTAVAPGYGRQSRGYLLRLPAEQGIYMNPILDQGSTLRVSVKDAAGGPVAGFPIKLSRAEPSRTRTDTRGIAEWPHLAAITYVAEFKAGGRRQRRYVSMKRRTDAVLEIVIGARLSGVVAGLAGAPLADAVVYVTSDSQEARVRTDPSGRFEVSGLGPGEYRIVATGDGHRIPGETVTLRPGGVKSIEIRPAGATVSGRVLVAVTGKGTSRGVVWLDPLGEGPRFQVGIRPAEDGTFTFWRVPPGRYRAHVYFWGGGERKAPEVEITVGEGGHVEDLVFQGAPVRHGHVELEILGKDGAPMEGVQFYVGVGSASTSMAPGAITPGRFRLKLEAGLNHIRMNGGVKGRARIEVEVRADETVYRSVQLR